MKTVFLSIPNFVYSADFLRTDYIKYLSSKYKVVVFIPPEAFCEDNKPYYKDENIVYVPWEIQFPSFWNLFGKYLRYSLIRTFDFEPVIVRNRENGLKNWKRKILRYISFLFPKSFFTNKLFTRLELFFLPKSFLFEEKIKEYKPDLVLTATPGFNHFDAEILMLAKKLNLKTAAINFSWDNLHNGGMHFRFPDYLIVWNEIIRNTAVKEYGYSPEKVFVSGTMRFDLYFKETEGELSREEFLKSKNLDPKKKTILITTVTKGNYPDENIILEKLLRAREDGRLQDNPNIFVRMHPKEEFKKFQSFIDSDYKNLCVDFPGKMLSKEMGTRIEMHEDDSLNLKATLKYCDVSINYLSTITLESFIFDKPVININFPEKYHRGYTFRHYKPIIDAKAVILSNSFDDFVDDINNCLKDPSIKREERKKIFNDFVFFKDGFSYKRNVDFLDKII